LTLIFREEHKLKEFQNRVLAKVLGFKIEKYGQLNNE